MNNKEYNDLMEELDRELNPVGMFEFERFNNMDWFDFIVIWGCIIGFSLWRIIHKESFNEFKAKVFGIISTILLTLVSALIINKFTGGSDRKEQL